MDWEPADWLDKHIDPAFVTRFRQWGAGDRRYVLRRDKGRRQRRGAMADASAPKRSAKKAAKIGHIGGPQKGWVASVRSIPQRTAKPCNSDELGSEARLVFATSSLSQFPAFSKDRRCSLHGRQAPPGPQTVANGRVLSRPTAA